jgi:hypothetical protein
MPKSLRLIVAGREPGAGATPRVLAEPVELELEVDGRVTPDREVGVDARSVAVGAKPVDTQRHRRVLLDVEEVVGAQVAVAIGVAGVDRGHLHLGRERRLPADPRRSSTSALNSPNEPRTLDTIM